MGSHAAQFLVADPFPCDELNRLRVVHIHLGGITRCDGDVTESCAQTWASQPPSGHHRDLWDDGGVANRRVEDASIGGETLYGLPRFHLSCRAS